MDKLISIIICITAGCLLQQYKVVKANGHVVINELLVNFFMPILIIVNISSVQFDKKLILPILVAWIIFAFAILFFVIIGKIKEIPSKTIAALIITGGISSTSFLGFPIFEMLYGKEGLQLAILMSQGGSFLIGITFGVAIASWYSSGTPSIKNILYNIGKFPPFIAFVLTLILNILGLQFSELIYNILNKLSSPFSVLALLSVGMQFSISTKDIQIEALSIGLLYKLIIAPTIIFILYRFLFFQNNFIVSVSVMGAAIGPMNTAAIIATKYNLNSKLATQMVAIGMPLSIPFLYIIHLILNS